MKNIFPVYEDCRSKKNKQVGYGGQGQCNFANILQIKICRKKNKKPGSNIEGFTDGVRGVFFGHPVKFVKSDN